MLSVPTNIHSISTGDHCIPVLSGSTCPEITQCLNWFGLFQVHKHLEFMKRGKTIVAWFVLECREINKIINKLILNQLL